MQIVIDIDENEYIGIKEFSNNVTSYPVTIHIYDAIRNGTPLPKGHGRLVDVNDLEDSLAKDKRDAFTKHNVWLMFSKYNEDVPTIIEADKETKDEDEPCSECKHHDIEDAQSGYCDSCYAGEYFKPKGGRGCR